MTIFSIDCLCKTWKHVRLRACIRWCTLAQQEASCHPPHPSTITWTAPHIIKHPLQKNSHIHTRCLFLQSTKFPHNVKQTQTAVVFSCMGNQHPSPSLKQILCDLEPQIWLDMITLSVRVFKRPKSSCDFFWRFSAHFVAKISHHAIDAVLHVVSAHLCAGKTIEPCTDQPKRADS